MRLNLTEKKIVKRIVEHVVGLEQQDRIAYHKGKKRQERKELQKTLQSILKKVSKDIEAEENKNKEEK